MTCKFFLLYNWNIHSSCTITIIPTALEGMFQLSYFQNPLFKKRKKSILKFCLFNRTFNGSCLVVTVFLILKTRKNIS